MPPVVDWDLLHRLIFETTLQRHSQRPSWSGQILNWDSLLRWVLVISSWALKLTDAGGVSTKYKKTSEPQGEKIDALVTELTSVSQCQLMIHGIPPMMPKHSHAYRMTLTNVWTRDRRLEGGTQSCFEHNPAFSKPDDSNHWFQVPRNFGGPS